MSSIIYVIHILLKISSNSRYVQSFSQVDLSKNFYFSYTYDITQSLQHNMTRPVVMDHHHPHAKTPSTELFEYNEMFVWNTFLLKSGFESLNSKWALPVIYGFVDQSSKRIKLNTKSI